MWRTGDDNTQPNARLAQTHTHVSLHTMTDSVDISYTNDTHRKHRLWVHSLRLEASVAYCLKNVGAQRPLGFPTAHISIWSLLAVDVAFVWIGTAGRVCVRPDWSMCCLVDLLQSKKGSKKKVSRLYLLPQEKIWNVCVKLRTNHDSIIRILIFIYQLMTCSLVKCLLK